MSKPCSIISNLCRKCSAAKKNGRPFYGCNDPVKSDTKSTRITDYQAVTACTGEVLEKAVKQKETDKQLCEKGGRNARQKQHNRIKSKTRARVEHIFGFIENSMGGSTLRTIGMEGAGTRIGLMNLTYNLFRVVQLCKVQGEKYPFKW